MLERPTLTGHVPAGFLARLEGRGFAGPYKVDPANSKMVVDRDGRSVHIGAPIVDRASPDGDREFAAFIAGALNLLTAEARAIRNPLDGPHLQAVTEESRRNLARLDRNHPKAAE